LPPKKSPFVVAKYLPNYIENKWFFTGRCLAPISACPRPSGSHAERGYLSRDMIIKRISVVYCKSNLSGLSPARKSPQVEKTGQVFAMDGEVSPSYKSLP
jgi:hypothetical protein